MRLFPFVAGMAAGAGLLYFLEHRRDLRDLREQFGEKRSEIEGEFGEVKSRVQGTVETARDRARETAERAKETVQSGAQQVRERVGTVAETAREQAEDMPGQQQSDGAGETQTDYQA